VAIFANLISFKNRLVNALLTAGAIAVLDWATIYYTGNNLIQQLISAPFLLYY
jgi:hypothetical protein